MTLRTLKAKVVKSLKIRGAKSVRLWALLQSMQDEGLWVVRELDVDNDGVREMEWWGLEDDSGIGIYVSL